MIEDHDVRSIHIGTCSVKVRAAAVASVEEDLRRHASAAAADAPPPALIEAANVQGLFARSCELLDLARIDGIYGSTEQCLQQVWPRVRLRWALIETGLAAVAAGTLSRQALRYEIARGDAWQRFEGQPEERDALLAIYASLVAHLDWPEGFARSALLEAFMLE